MAAADSDIVKSIVADPDVGDPDMTDPDVGDSDVAVMVRAVTSFSDRS